MEPQHIPGIPNGNWNINTWLEGTTYYAVNTESRIVLGYNMETASCGCCSNPVDVEWTWDELNEEERELILTEFRDGQYK